MRFEEARMNNMALGLASFTAIAKIAQVKAKAEKEKWVDKIVFHILCV